MNYKLLLIISVYFLPLTLTASSPTSSIELSEFLEDGLYDFFKPISPITPHAIDSEPLVLENAALKMELASAIKYHQDLISDYRRSAGTTIKKVTSALSIYLPALSPSRDLMENKQATVTDLSLFSNITVAAISAQKNKLDSQSARISAQSIKITSLETDLALKSAQLNTNTIYTDALTRKCKALTDQARRNETTVKRARDTQRANKALRQEIEKLKFHMNAYRKDHKDQESKKPSKKAK